MKKLQPETIAYYDWYNIQSALHAAGLDSEELYDKWCNYGYVNNGSYSRISLDEDEPVEKFIIELVGTDMPIIYFYR